MVLLGAYLRPHCLILCVVLSIGVVMSSLDLGGQTIPLFSPLVAAPAKSSSSTLAPIDCGFISLQSVAALTFRQRTCLYTKQLISPRFALAAAFASAFEQYENLPHVPAQRFNEFPHRLSVYYSRRATRDTAELLVGYWHKEDPRFRRSNAQSFWRRTDSAIMNVLTSPDENGHLRPAYAPIAGSLSSAFVGSVMYHHQETLQQTLGHAAAVYSYCFVRNFLAEFRPEVHTYVRHLLHREN